MNLNSFSEFFSGMNFFTKIVLQMPIKYTIITIDKCIHCDTLKANKNKKIKRRDGFYNEKIY